MKKLIINADDFGYRDSINKGIIYAHKNGLVTSASLFVERDGVGNAIELARQNPSLGLGIHVDLDKYFEIDHHMGVIVQILNKTQNYQEIEGDIRKQIEKFNSFGFKADHLDSHHHAHMYPSIFPIICKLAREFSIPVVRFFNKFYESESIYADLKRHITENNLKKIDHFIEGWYWGNIDEPYQVAELMTHPGYEELWREAELAHCCQRNLKDYLVEQKIELLRFSDL